MHLPSTQAGQHLFLPPKNLQILLKGANVCTCPLEIRRCELFIGLELPWLLPGDKHMLINQFHFQEFNMATATVTRNKAQAAYAIAKTRRGSRHHVGGEHVCPKGKGVFVIAIRGSSLVDIPKV